MAENNISDNVVKIASQINELTVAEIMQLFLIL